MSEILNEMLEGMCEFCDLDPAECLERGYCLYEEEENHESLE